MAAVTQWHTRLVFFPSAMLDILSIEVLQYLIYHHAHSPQDALAVALTNKGMYRKLLGELGEENEHDQDQLMALAGVKFCVENEEYGAARLAILRRHGDPNEAGVEDHWGNPYALLCFMSMIGEEEVVEALLGHPDVDPAVQESGALELACSNLHIEIVKLLLANDKIDPAARDNYVIKDVAKAGYPDILQLLLEDGRADPAADNNEPLRLAAEGGHIDNVRLLLADERVDPSPAALQAAIDNEHPTVVALFNDQSGSGDDAAPDVVPDVVPDDDDVSK